MAEQKEQLIVREKVKKNKNRKLRRSYGILCTCGNKKEGKEEKETTNALSGTRGQRREVWRWLVVVEKVMHAGVCSSLVYNVVCTRFHTARMPTLSCPRISVIFPVACVSGPPSPQGEEMNDSMNEGGRRGLSPPP